MKENLPKNCEPISMVYQTTDYEWFKFIEQNRRTDHVKALIASFTQRDVPNAILCNAKGQIIDGQNRFLARKEMGLPIIFYVINNLDIYDVAFLNSYGKNWGAQDFVDMWAALGVDEYVKIKKFHNMFPDLSLQSVLMILSDSVNSQKGSIGLDEYAERRGLTKKKDYLKSGDFKIKDWDHSVMVANSIMQYKPFARPGVQVYKHTAFASAMMKLLRKKNFENAEMVRRASMYPDMFYKCINSDNYIKMLNDLWNRGRRKERISFSY